MPFRFYPIFRREMKSYLTSPSVYVAIAMYLFLSGIFFYGILVNFAELSSNAEYRRQLGVETENFTQHVVTQLFWAINFLLLFLVPMVTMRLLAEEKKSGTFELLKSLPFTDWNIVTAKFLAAYSLIAGMLLLSGYYVGIMARFGSPEMPVVLISILGILISSAAYVSIGLFASSLTENQIVAAIVSFVLLFGLFLVGDLTTPASGGINRILETLSMRAHADNFTKGLFRLEDVIYFFTITTVFLFMTCRTLEIRRWRV